jgi:SAM-dependent methyltransferase
LKSSETSPHAADPDETPGPESASDAGRGQIPIAVSEGDFSTPMTRKRTITRPRGLKTLEQSPLPPENSPPGAEPVAIVIDEPVGHQASVVDEFLAAPPTPEPEVLNTPAPVVAQLPDEALSVSEATPAPVENVAVAIEIRTAIHSDEPDVVRRDLAASVEAQGTGDSDRPDPDSGVLNSLLEEATAHLVSSGNADGIAPLVAPQEIGTPGPDGEQTALLPAERRDSGDAGLSPLAQTLANMAESMTSELVVDSVADFDIVDAPLVPKPPSASVDSLGPRPPPLPSIGAVAESVSTPGDDSRLPVPASAVVPEALAERPRRPKRSKPWFEEVFDESYLRTLPFMTADQTLREVDFIESSLSVPKGGEVLDVACGYGRHAIELVQRGLTVTGLDLSLPLLIRAADESQRREVSVNFVHSDMREISFERQFAGAYCMLTSFGYFDEESNMRVIEGIARALKPGGRFLIDVVNRDYIVGDLPARIWWEGDGCVVLEEVDFNFNTNRILTHRSVVFEDGQQLEQEISVRVYSLHEMGKLLRQAGFRVLEVSGSIPTKGHFFGANSRNLLILAERRSE